MGSISRVGLAIIAILRPHGAYGQPACVASTAGNSRESSCQTTNTAIEQVLDNNANVIQSIDSIGAGVSASGSVDVEVGFISGSTSSDLEVSVKRACYSFDRLRCVTSNQAGDLLSAYDDTLSKLLTVFSDCLSFEQNSDTFTDDLQKAMQMQTYVPCFKSYQDSVKRIVVVSSPSFDCEGLKTLNDRISKLNAVIDQINATWGVSVSKFSEFEPETCEGPFSSSMNPCVNSKPTYTSSEFSGPYTMLTTTGNNEVPVITKLESSVTEPDSAQLSASKQWKTADAWVSSSSETYDYTRAPGLAVTTTTTPHALFEKEIAYTVTNDNIKTLTYEYTATSTAYWTYKYTPNVPQSKPTELPSASSSKSTLPSETSSEKLLSRPSANFSVIDNAPSESGDERSSTLTYEYTETSTAYWTYKYTPNVPQSKPTEFPSASSSKSTSPSETSSEKLLPKPSPDSSVIENTSSGSEDGRFSTLTYVYTETATYAALTHSLSVSHSTFAVQPSTLKPIGSYKTGLTVTQAGSYPLASRTSNGSGNDFPTRSKRSGVVAKDSGSKGHRRPSKTSTPVSSSARHLPALSGPSSNYNQQSPSSRQRVRGYRSSEMSGLYQGDDQEKSATSMGPTTLRRANSGDKSASPDQSTTSIGTFYGSPSHIKDASAATNSDEHHLGSGTPTASSGSTQLPSMRNISSSHRRLNNGGGPTSSDILHGSIKENPAATGRSRVSYKSPSVTNVQSSYSAESAGPVEDSKDNGSSHPTTSSTFKGDNTIAFAVKSGVSWSNKHRPTDLSYLASMFSVTGERPLSVDHGSSMTGTGLTNTKADGKRASATSMCKKSSSTPSCGGDDTRIMNADSSTRGHATPTSTLSRSVGNSKQHGDTSSLESVSETSNECSSRSGFGAVPTSLLLNGPSASRKSSNGEASPDIASSHYNSIAFHASIFSTVLPLSDSASKINPGTSLPSAIRTPPALSDNRTNVPSRTSLTAASNRGDPGSSSRNLEGSRMHGLGATIATTKSFSGKGRDCSTSNQIEVGITRTRNDGNSKSATGTVDETRFKTTLQKSLDTKGISSTLAKSGNREQTTRTYLNDGEKGSVTSFAASTSSTTEISSNSATASIDTLDVGSGTSSVIFGKSHAAVSISANESASSSAPSGDESGTCAHITTSNEYQPTTNIISSKSGSDSATTLEVNYKASTIVRPSQGIPAATPNSISDSSSLGKKRSKSILGNENGAAATTTGGEISFVLANRPKTSINAAGSIGEWGKASTTVADRINGIGLSPQSHIGSVPTSAFSKANTISAQGGVEGSSVNSAPGEVKHSVTISHSGSESNGIKGSNTATFVSSKETGSVLAGVSGGGTMSVDHGDHATNGLESFDSGRSAETTSGATTNATHDGVSVIAGGRPASSTQALSLSSGSTGSKLSYATSSNRLMPEAPATETRSATSSVSPQSPLEAPSFVPASNRGHSLKPVAILVALGFATVL